MAFRILIVDEDVRSREELEILLASEGCVLTWAAEESQAVVQLASAPFDAILCADALAGRGEPCLWARLAHLAQGAPMVLLGQGPESRLAAEALGHGALECLAKPLHAASLRLLLARLRAHARLRRAGSLLQREVDRANSEHPIVAASPAMIALLEVVERVAEYRAPILLRGERGTGKTILARAIHAQTSRRHEAFVCVRCHAGSETASESELFGHVPGAFSGADRGRRGLLLEAHGGTAFFDDIDALSPAVQERLLLLLQDEAVKPLGSAKAHPTDVRVITATSEDPESLVERGRLLPGLAERLSRVQVHVPPLRERREDLPLLADHFLRRTAMGLGRPTRSIAGDALQHLIRHDWPGNVRELANVVEAAVLRSTGERLTLADLPAAIAAAKPDEEDTRAAELSLRRARRRFEADLIRRALQATGGNRTHAARLLQISHRALLYKLKEYGLRGQGS